MNNIAVFASGGGSNAKKIIEYFQHHSLINVALILTNNSKAGVIQIAKDYDIPCIVVEKNEFKLGTNVVQLLQQHDINYVILAGFLLLVPEVLIKAFPDRILNIHPSLLPKYGGKGMFGHHVHEKVKEMGEKETGMTIHLVNEKYDQGAIIFQKKCAINQAMTSDDIAAEVLKLEHIYYSQVIESYISKSK